NVLMAVSCFVVFVGTMWPLVAELFFDRTLSVGPPFFNIAFTPFMVALAVILPIGSVLPWKRAKLGGVFHRLRYWIALVVALACLIWAMQTGQSALGPIGIALGVWLVVGAGVELWDRSHGSLDRAGRLPRADWGKATAHAGLGITFIGVAGLMAYEVEDIRVAQIGETYEVAGHTLTLNDVREVVGPNYISTMAFIDLEGAEVLRPERRIYPIAGMPTTEAAIRNGFIEDVYVVIGEQQGVDAWVVRTFIKPFANWIWGGSILMALGGLISLTDRRFRVAAGAKRQMPELEPAE
ncbi:MAG: cytochrome c-type biogenesis CcmF C-terminal domain-containing protein, partial [Shimia sp.]